MTSRDIDQTVARVRRFTRFYTQRLGVLREALHDSALSLAEGRVVYEIAHAEGITASDLVGTLGLDPGYLSRLLQGLERRGFLTRKKSSVDARRRDLGLTDQGRREFDRINVRSDQEVRDLVTHLGDTDRVALIEALQSVETLLGDDQDV